MDKDKIQKIRQSCQLSLIGHPQIRPKECFIQLSECITKEERSDFYGIGESLNQFEVELAKILGQPACVFLPSGTMAQLIALRIWSDRSRNNLVAFHPLCHLEIHEKDSYRVLHNLKAILLGNKKRLITLEDLKAMEEAPSVVLLELPQREIGGHLPSWLELKEQINYLHSQNIKVHMDGARLWECASYYNKPYSEIASLFDSVYVSFYKGIGAISGAALLGSENFIEKARVWLRRHGGNLHTQFPNYLSAKLNFTNRIGNFEAYFRKTQEIAQIISQFKEFEVSPNPPQVNMFHLYLRGDKDFLINKALEIADETGVWTFSNLQDTDQKRLYKLEWYVGDETMQVPPEKMKEVLGRLAAALN